MDFTRLTQFLDRVPALGIPGLDCVVQIGYDTVYRHHCGYADREAKTPVSGDELFYLYSCSKVVTSVAALQLYESGAFLLTDPLYDYIPEFRDMTVRTVRSNGEVILSKAQNSITIGDLFSMTAGLDYDLTVPMLQKVREKTGGKAPTLEVVKALAGQPLQFEPGTHWRYSLCHDVLGGLIQVITGKTFGAYLRENIFDPLEMPNTGFARPPEVLQKMMTLYRRDEETNIVHRVTLDNEFIFGTEYESGGAGLISCVQDYARFAAALANGGVGANGNRILSQNTIDLMRTNRLNATQQADFDWIQFKGYGYGLGVRTMVDKAVGGSPGPLGEFGWAGAAGAYVLVDPENQLSMFYTQHMRKSLEPYVHPRLRNILYACL